MAVTPVGSPVVSGFLDSGQASTANIAVTAGNQLIVAMIWAHTTDATITISSLTCNGQNFTLIGAPTRAQVTGMENAIQFAYISNITSSGSFPVSVTMTSTSFNLTGQFSVWQTSGGSTTAFEGSVSLSGGVSSVPSVNVGAAGADDFTVGICRVSATAGFDPGAGSGYTLVAMDDSILPTSAEYKAGAHSGTVDFSGGTASAWLAGGARFVAAGGGGGGKQISIKLIDEAGADAASLAGLKVYVWDTANPATVATTLPAEYTAVETTDAAGMLTVPLSNITTAVGGTVLVLVTQSSGDPAQNPPARSHFAPVAVTST